MKMEQTECSETSAYEIQTPGNYAEEGIQRIYSYLLRCINPYPANVKNMVSY